MRSSDKCSQPISAKFVRSAVSRARAWYVVITFGLLLLLGAGHARAQEISVTVNGEPVMFNGFGPRQIEGRTFVPVRGVMEKLGAAIAWMPQTQTVIASTPNMDIELHLGDKRATVNGKEVMLDVPAQELAGHTMVPLRFLGEALGADVKWNSQTRTVVIVTNDAAVGSTAPPTVTNPHRSGLPANTQNTSAPTIASFTQDSKGWLRPGQTIHVDMEGTPGGQASFRIPGVAEQVAMRETAPGHYTGSWQAPEGKNLQLSDAAIIGDLKIGNRSAPLIQAAGAVSVDTTAPRIHDRAPEDGSRVTGARPNISAEYDDKGSGVDRASVRLYINNKDVTPEATVAKGFVSYTPASPLPPGQQSVRLVISDHAGNSAESAWAFMQEPRAAGGIKTVTDNASHTLEPGDSLHVEMTGTPGGSAVFSLGSIHDVKMQEDRAGHYVADYTVHKGDDVQRAVVAVRLTTADGEKFVQQSERAVTVNTGKPTAPVITSPGPNDALANPLVIKGKATPNMDVHVKVDYRNKVFGVLGLQGTAADVVVKADKNGIWQTEPINLSNLFSNRNVDYTITATALNAAEEKSDATSLKFRLK